MSVTPFLSICVPSRNRQIYFQQTIDSLRGSLRTDIQLVFADNSDDPSIMNAFMEEVVADPRVVYLPSTDRTLSMVDNWERTMAAATGDFVVFIGDDDYVDPEVAGYLKRLLAVNPGIDGFGWRLVGFTWPYPGRPKLSAMVPFENISVKVQQTDLFKRMFGWYDARHVPTSGFSVYHSAISRRLMERIRHLYGGRFFEHPIVDYDNGFKVICLGNSFAATARPFGIMGSCPLSNSFAVGKREDNLKKMAQFADEVGREFDQDEEFRKFPFRITMGTTGAIGVAQHWFKTKYNITYENWGEGFAKACAVDCALYADRESFDAASEAYRAAFALWENGRYLKFFTPEFNENLSKTHGSVSSGFTDGGVFIDQDIGAAETPLDIYRIISGMVIPVDQMEVDPSGLKYAWETDSAVAKMMRA